MNGLTPYFLTAGFSLCVGVAIGWWGHNLAISRDDRNRVQRGKDEFLNTTAAWSSQITSRSHELAKLHCESIGPISEAVYRAKPYLTGDQFHTLRSVLTEYQAITEDQMNQDKSEVLQIAEGIRGLPETPAADERLRSYFARFEKAIG